MSLEQENIINKSRERELLEEEKVAQYLNDHPNFFSNWENLLTEIKLPHRSGSAISLVERQVGILRDRNMDLRHRLSKLLDVAKENDQFFERTRLLTLALIEAGSLRSVVNVLEKVLIEQFDIDSVSLILYEDSSKDQHKILRKLNPDICKEKLSGLLQGRNIVCAPLREDEAAFLFPHSQNPIASAAIVPLVFKGSLGILSIGSHDAGHFKSNMGTLFIGHIGDILSRIVRPYLISIPNEV